MQVQRRHRQTRDHNAKSEARSETKRRQGKTRDNKGTQRDTGKQNVTMHNLRRKGKTTEYSIWQKRTMQNKRRHWKPREDNANQELRSNAIQVEETHIWSTCNIFFSQARDLENIWTRPCEFLDMFFGCIADKRSGQPSNSTSTTLLHPDISEDQLMVRHELVDDLVMVVVMTSAQHPPPRCLLGSKRVEEGTLKTTTQETPRKTPQMRSSLQNHQNAYFLKGFLYWKTTILAAARNPEIQGAAEHPFREASSSTLLEPKRHLGGGVLSRSHHHHHHQVVDQLMHHHQLSFWEVRMQQSRRCWVWRLSWSLTCNHNTFREMHSIEFSCFPNHELAQIEKNQND